jgi:hypothetical protein
MQEDILIKTRSARKKDASRSSFVKGCFLLLAGGSLPILFMRPLDYLVALFVCFIMAWGLSKILL